VARLVIWVKVDRVAAETKSDGAVELQRRHDLNQQQDSTKDTNSTMRNCKASTRVLGQQNFLCMIFVDYRTKAKSELGIILTGIPESLITT
jgi:phosphate-selective porin